jgi:hypothetical protein
MTRLETVQRGSNILAISLEHYAKNPSAARWIVAQSGRAHLDLGERSSESLRVHADHIIVTACHAHVGAEAQVVEESHAERCSNCLRIWRTIKQTPRAGLSPAAKAA